MPQYVGLGQTGFYEPYQILGAGLANLRQRKTQEKQLGLEERRVATDESRAKADLETEKLRRQMLQRQIERLMPTKFELPQGMRAKSISVDELGNPTTVYEPLPPVQEPPAGLKPIKQTVNSRGESETTYGPDIAGGGTSIVQRPLPNGGTGLFLAHRDAETGQERLQPYNPRSEQDVRVGNELMQKLNITSLALSQLPKYQELVRSAGDAGGPVVSKIGKPFAWAFGPSKERLAFDTLRAQSLAPIAKGILGETGALSEADMARYAPLLPQFEDTQVARLDKLARLERLVTEQRDNILTNLKAGRYDVSELSKVPSLQTPSGVIAPAPPPEGGPPLIETQEQYDALPPGAQYRDSSGKTFTKK